MKNIISKKIKVKLITQFYNNIQSILDFNFINTLIQIKDLYFISTMFILHSLIKYEGLIKD